MSGTSVSNENSEDEIAGRAKLSAGRRHMIPRNGWLNFGFDRLDLDVDQCRFLGLRRGFVNGFQIFIDGLRRRLGGLVDNELDSGLRYFNWYGINNHGMTSWLKNVRSPFTLCKEIGLTAEWVNGGAEPPGRAHSPRDCKAALRTHFAVEGSKAFVKSLNGRIVETSGTRIYRAESIPR